MNKHLKLDLVNIEEATQLAQRTGIIEKAEVHIALDEQKDNEYPYIAYVGTTGGLRTIYLGASNVDELVKWATDKDKVGTYAIVYEKYEMFEIIKHEAITGIKVEIDSNLIEEMKKFEETDK